MHCVHLVNILQKWCLQLAPKMDAKKNSATFHPDTIWNDCSFGLSEERRPTRKTTRRRTTRTEDG